VVGVLLIACGNVAGMLTAQGGNGGKSPFEPRSARQASRHGNC
jgi:hypothetical protein